MKEQIAAMEPGDRLIADRRSAMGTLIVGIGIELRDGTFWMAVDYADRPGRPYAPIAKEPITVAEAAHEALTEGERIWREKRQ